MMPASRIARSRAASGARGRRVSTWTRVRCAAVPALSYLDSRMDDGSLCVQLFANGSLPFRDALSYVWEKQRGEWVSRGSPLVSTRREYFMVLWYYNYDRQRCRVVQSDEIWMEEFVRRWRCVFRFLKTWVRLGPISDEKSAWSL